MKILKLGQMLGGSNSPSAAGLENLYSLDFDGTNDRAEINDDSIFSFNNGHPNYQDQPFSFSMWVKFASSLVEQGLLSKDATGQSEYGIGTDAAGLLLFRLFDANTTNNYIQTLTDASFSTGTWIHIVCTYDASETAAGLTIYSNGVAPAQTTSETGSYARGMDNTTSAVVYGVWGRLRDYLEGNLDELSCWDIELSSAQVTSLYNGGTPTDLTGEAGLIGWWRNGDPDGTSVYPTIEDQTANNNDATMINMASGDIVTDVP